MLKKCFAPLILMLFFIAINASAECVVSIRPLKDAIYSSGGGGSVGGGGYSSGGIGFTDRIYGSRISYEQPRITGYRYFVIVGINDKGTLSYKYLSLDGREYLSFFSETEVQQYISDLEKTWKNRYCK